MNILGISCYYHDSAAVLVQDGRITAAVQEERFTREKNTPAFPVNAINYCVQAGGITFDDVDYVVIHEKPFLKFARVILSHLRAYPFSISNFLSTVPNWLKERMSLPLLIEEELGYKGKVLFVKHHLSHEAAAFLASSFESAAIFTADAVGEQATTTIGHGRANKIKVFNEMIYPDSLGLLYTAFTTYLGFSAHRGEGKVMGLAAYGEPKYIDEFRDLYDIAPDGSFRVKESFFGFNKGRRMFSRKLIKKFGSPRKRDDEITQRHKDIAASLQFFLEEILIKIANDLYDKTKEEALCLSGGIFLNCVANAKILKHTPFKKIFIQPAAGDSGGALGAALYVHNTLLDNPRREVMEHAYLGPDFPERKIKIILSNTDLVVEELDEDLIIERAANSISQGKIIGWFQGRSEFGPRALGNRSILANPCIPDIKDTLNNKVKHREEFRPFAPSVLEEASGEYFDLNVTSPFMLLAPDVKESEKDKIPGIVHADGTARVQTVSKKTNPIYWALIEKLGRLTGVPMVLNTSFNLRGEPIVNSPEDAIDCFQRSNLDHLVIERFFVSKKEMR